ncbi:MAG TPA: helix-turn-helix transcriptional regulator [Thermoanaerobaculia bacterium]|jgi:transcriptional regulator with XRE-family HTH domain|nr:helix-turn-helix transcriptional regulator [Thermoanaerobaculia bacterium]
MLLHEELRAAREAAGFTQSELAKQAGIPRNQVVRAEKGENITLDTLRKIAAFLPLENLTLLEKLKLDFDYIPQPEKLYLGALTNVSQALEALRSAIGVAMAARLALATARRADPNPTSEGMNKVDDLLLLKTIGRSIEDVAAKLKEIA